MNKVFLKGNVGQDPKITTFQDCQAHRPCGRVRTIREKGNPAFDCGKDSNPPIPRQRRTNPVRYRNRRGRNGIVGREEIRTGPGPGTRLQADRRLPADGRA